MRLKIIISKKSSELSWFAATVTTKRHYQEKAGQMAL
jgi:hypothetical protein